MTISDESRRTIDAYLEKVRNGLRGLRQEDAGEIIAELQSHILDRAGAAGEVTPAGVTAALAALGNPEELASGYMTDALLARAASTRMPWTILRGAFLWATLSVKGFIVLLFCVVGYMFGGAFFLAALIKPFNPKVGLWVLDNDTYSLALGMTDYGLRGHELLGWYLIPIGCALGGGTILLTTQFALWSIRRFRRARAAAGIGRGL